jgi:hypothetical protein
MDRCPGIHTSSRTDFPLTIALQSRCDMATTARTLLLAVAGPAFVLSAVTAQQPAADRTNLPKYGLTKLDVAPGDSPQWGGTSLRNNAPYDGKVYLPIGQDPDHGEGPGCLWCLDPTSRFDGGDVSPQLVVDGEGRPAELPRGKQIDEVPGLRVRPNPHSAAVWSYETWPAAAGGGGPFEEIMHRSCAPVVIADDLVYAVDISGLVHCVDAQTGRPYWTHDLFSGSWGWNIGPLLVDGKLFVPAEDNRLTVLAHGKTKKVLAENDIGDCTYTTPIVAGDILYFATRTHLHAVQEPK